MKSRKSTPDIMSNLMNSALPVAIEPASVQILQPANNKTIMQNTDELSTFVDHKGAQPVSNKAVKTVMPSITKEKTTFNLSQEIIQDLEDAWIKLRRKLKGEQRISKTLIVEKSIKIMLADFESRSELSDIFMELKS